MLHESRNPLSNARVVVLDDDPTGTQAATDVTVLMDADVDALVEILRVRASVYVQTNSRALAESDAISLASRIRDAVGEARRRLGVDVRIVLRGDSTLRGHVVAESRVFMGPDAVMLFVPAFPGGGRETRVGMHYVRVGSALVAVAETEYARDPVFGYSTSHLPDFLASRGIADVTAVSRERLHSGGLRAELLAATPGSAVVVDAVDDADIQAIAAATVEAWQARDVVVRSAAPLAAALAGVTSPGLLDPRMLAGASHALVVCGSHTAGAREQVSHLSEQLGAPNEIDTARALQDPEAEGRRVAEHAMTENGDGRVLFVTSQRQRAPEHDTLAHGAAVMSALTTAAHALLPAVDTVITKGGITSAAVIRESLGATHAHVLGQLLPGVSVWRASAADGRELPCIVVPGNMGEVTILWDAVRWSIADGAATLP